MWTKDKVEKFIKDNPNYDDYRSYPQFKPRVVTDVCDGDVFHTVSYPWFAYNPTLVSKTINILNLVKDDNSIRIYFHSPTTEDKLFIFGGVVIVFYEHYCDPD